jgi:MFS family permease
MAGSTQVRSDRSVFLRVTMPLAGVNFLNQASRALIATIGPILALEFSLSATELGLLAGTFFASYCAAQLPAGLAMDLYGVRRVQIALALVAAIGFAICALSAGVLSLAIGRLVTGLGISVGMIAMLTAHGQWVPRSKVPAITGAGIFLASFGGLLATLPAQLIIPTIGWRGVFWLMAVVAAFVSAAIWYFVPEPARKPRRVMSVRQELGEYRRIFTHIAFLRFAPALIILSGLNFAYGGLWAGPWLRDVGGFSDEPRAVLLLVYMSGMMVGSFCSGQVATFLNHRGYDQMSAAWIAMAGLFFCQIALLFYDFAYPGWVGLLWFSFAFFSAAGPTGYSAIAGRFPAELAGRVGTALNGSMLAFVFVLQNAIGWILDLWPRAANGGWSPAGYFWAMVVTLVLQALATIWMVSPRRTQ